MRKRFTSLHTASTRAMQATTCVFALMLAALICACSTPGRDEGAVSAGPPDRGVATAPVRYALPPMGWNSWNAFSCNIDEKKILAVADAMASNGMAQAGYRYVTVDDCWVGGRDPKTGKLYADAHAFPGGIAALANYVHSKGLKFGLYTSGNVSTCAGMSTDRHPPSWPQGANGGSLGHERIDAQTFADWGVDYLKLDLCGGKLSTFAAMRAGIAASGRPMYLSINPYSYNRTLRTRFADDGTFYAPAYADTSRISQDITESFASVESIVDIAAADAAWAVPGYFNDLDMLEVGHAFSADQDVAHFIMWAVMASPLNAGNDVRTQRDATRALLTNPGIIAVNQDALALPAVLDQTDSMGALQVWTRPLVQSGTRAVAFINRGAAPVQATVRFASVGLDAPHHAWDLLTGSPLPVADGSVSVTVPATGARLIRLDGRDPVAATGPLAAQRWIWSVTRAGSAANDPDSEVGVKVWPAAAPQPLLPAGAKRADAIVAGGVAYRDGMAVSVPTQIVYRLGRQCSSFQSDIGLDRRSPPTSRAAFQVWADNVLLYDSGPLSAATPPKTVRVDISGRDTLRLVVTPRSGGDARDRAAWADPSVVCTSGSVGAP
ncbi:NPCBM/NEW2 domain-containing protein [Paraburkholderia kururiensis]|uniref:Alpha-galactosidase n=1 Tax=Paraburkholderia kururiensis TaxID=984307 RepID=A0ABZ0WMU8_9BURK|nr:NPCBM/NEW2 domain-containing protein [Paraburkholderia kururiensis]WQD78697.1 NPCBM/NEW2 domain-containing protein [Paraburkholderia kururiensis]